MIREGTENKVVAITLAPTPLAQRIYPSGPLEEGEPIQWMALSTPSPRFAGVWDDVYASWSGLHGYVRPVWQVTDGSAVHLRPAGLDHIMHFVEETKTSHLLRCGVNFVHQSTTGMSHAITNGYDPKMTASYERIYFSDCLVTVPAHASYTEEWADRTKMMIVGGYLPREAKLALKRNGSYSSALLYLWKAALPFDVPYDHELRHRVAYRSLGREDQFQGGYGHAGGERGDLSLEYHRYDEIAHMRGMIRMAESLSVLPPEAVLGEMDVQGGKSIFQLKKAALILQEPGQEVTVEVSTAACYDLQDRPLSVRWKLLYGNHETTCLPGEAPDTWVVRVPWDDTLPEGRTALALIANNGVHDGNPAILSIFRKWGDLPPLGFGPGEYAYDSPHANRRPVLLGLQDQVVKPSAVVKIPLLAIDPEGQPVRFYKRAGEPGEIDGNLYTLKVPGGKAGTSWSVTIIASDGTAGISYAAKRVEFAVSPRVHAHIECESLIGAAPFSITASSRGSLPSRGKVERGWEFYQPVTNRKGADWKEMSHDATATHTFEKPGLYEVALTLKSGAEEDRETVQVFVTDGPPPASIGGVVLEGNGVRIADGDDAPCAFDHTHFGAVKAGESVTHRFMLFNRGDEAVSRSSRAVTLAGPDAGEFRLVKAPVGRISPHGSMPFELQFRPKGAGARTAEVTLRAGTDTVRFTVAGLGGPR